MKLSSGTVGGTPSGGAIIFGSDDGMELNVALGEGMVLGSLMMLVPTMKLVLLSVAVATRDTTGVGVPDGIVGIAMVGVSLGRDVTASVMVAFVGVCALTVMLPGGADTVTEDGPSDAGTLSGGAVETVATGGAEVPTTPVDGSTPLTVGVATGGVTVRGADGDCVGSPEGTNSEDGISPEEIRASEEGRTGGTELIGMGAELMGIGAELMGMGAELMRIGADAVGKRVSTPGRTLDRAVGNGVGPTSETTEDRMLGRSGTSVERIGGRIPDKEGVGVTTGAVGPRSVPEGKMPFTSETTEDKIGGRLSRPELAGNSSEVGIGAEVTIGAVGVGRRSPVPSAVVSPTTIPELMSERRGSAVGDTSGALVG